MHLTLKREATKPAALNVLQQQARFDDFVTRDNTDRPHQALDMKVPADLYARSPRVYRGLAELAYPFHDQMKTWGVHNGLNSLYAGVARRQDQVGHALSSEPAPS